jgi:hypothetical protein
LGLSVVISVVGAVWPVEFNRDWLVVKSLLWYKGKLFQQKILTLIVTFGRVLARFSGWLLDGVGGGLTLSGTSRL